ncbi:hypothetical protein EXE48_11600 [Halorubrum sp. ASP1]|uniref:hypothetical protein n=1 Tax=Halorubrum sp. ASP1 TaxID=2518114 RepID=UPI0010F48332|nr:hypothetical protein [Halorubrum sp. ASP1]TKX60610.1 hypothetical protein EXE48_11600 [Halorubrum sp. ASP1]
MPSENDQNSAETDADSHQRIEVIVKSTRKGNLATFADTSAGSGIRPMTNTEVEAHDFLKDVVAEVDAEAHESGDIVAEVFVDTDGECSVEWADDAIRRTTDGGIDEPPDGVGRDPDEQLRIDLLNAFYRAFKNGVSEEQAKQHAKYARETAKEDASNV